MKYLKNLRTTDIDTHRKYTFILPIGATEQHGPFIPLGTDTYITDTVLASISEEFSEAIVLPTLEYSKSEEHRGFPGTIWLLPETLKAVLRDLYTSLHPYTEQLVLTSFHANDSVIKEFIEEAQMTDCRISHLELCNDEDVKEIEALLKGPADDHAGNTEISNMLAINPSLVTKPDPSYPKVNIENPWETNNIHEFSNDGIADNHPDWIVNNDIGKTILDIYTNRATVNLKRLLKE